MPPHIAILDLAGNPAAPLDISVSGGQESAISTLEIWNDKNLTHGDTTTAQDIRAKLLTSVVIGYQPDDTPIYGPYRSSGEPITGERWSRFRITHKLSAAGATTEGATGTHPIGSNAEVPIPDLAPGEGVRIEFFIVAPGGSTADAAKIKLQVIGNASSSPLAQMVGLPLGSSVVPGDRVAGLRALLRGGTVTADDSDTVTADRGHIAYDGAVHAFVTRTSVQSLADSDAVNLGVGESYNATLSLSDAAALVVTKGPKAEAVAFPSTPAGNVFLAHFVVESPDGAVVTIAQASVDQSGVTFAEFYVRDGGGLSVVVSPGDGLTDTDHRQYLSHSVPVALAANVTSRVWRNPDGSLVDTLTDVPPVIGSDLLALVTTDTDSVTAITDARVFAHRALVMDRIELSYRGVFSQLVTPAHAIDLAIVHFDCEVESVEANITDADPLWTSGAIVADVIAFAPGAAVPYPAGGVGVGGASLFTSSATDDARPSIAFDATDLRAISLYHEVRRLAAGTRLVLTIAATVAASAPEADQELRVTLHVRRYR